MNFMTSFDQISSKNDPDSFLFDVDSVYNCILSFKKGKAADFKNLTVEHFQFAHPSLTIVVVKMFCLMLTLGFVPRGFGCGLSYLIPKCTNRTVSACVDEHGTGLTLPSYSEAVKSHYRFNYCTFQMGASNTVQSSNGVTRNYPKIRLR